MLQKLRYPSLTEYAQQAPLTFSTYTEPIFTKIAEPEPHSKCTSKSSSNQLNNRTRKRIRGLLVYTYKIPDTRIPASRYLRSAYRYTMLTRIPFSDQCTTFTASRTRCHSSSITDQGTTHTARRKNRYAHQGTSFTACGTSHYSMDHFTLLCNCI